MEAVDNKLEDSWKEIETENTMPVVVVVGAEDSSFWCHTPPQVNVTMWSTPSGPSSGSCTPNTRSPSLNSFCSDVSWSDGENDVASLFRPRGNRSRHGSTEVLSCSRGMLTVAPERLCASHDHLDSRRLKTENQEPSSHESGAKAVKRERSASVVSVASDHRHSSSDSRVKKFLSKIRSNSHHDLMHGRARSVSSPERETPKDSLVPEPHEVPATAINTGLLGLFRKHGPDLKKRRWSAWEDRVLRLRGHRSHGENSTVPDAGKCAALASDTPGSEAQAVPDKRRVSRTRSNSESAIIVHKRKRNRSFLPRESRVRDLLLDFHHRKKRGSLPFVEAEQQQQQQQQAPRASHGTEDATLSLGGRALSCHDLTEFAVDNYFGEDPRGTLSEDEAGGERPHCSLLTAEGYLQGRGRRPRFSIDSIWNVLRGRRLSHDVGAAGRHVTEAVVPWLRGKSRSVDHSIHSPFDLDLLRKKIGERTSSEPSRGTRSPSPEPVEGSKENIAPAGKKMVVKTLPPIPTMTYRVSASDTLTSIAARFDTTPSELTKLNKLSTRFVYPGQVIAVPDKAATRPTGTHHPPDDTGGGHDPLTHIRPPSPTQRGDLRSPASPHTCPRTPTNSVETEKSLDRECLEKFLKISVRHITDGQGVVAGVLLVTPNAVMFDPNVSDPLVIEHGPESYGVIAPMEFVVNAALYYDIAHMRVRDTNLPKPEIPKPEIYWGPGGQVERMGSQESPGKDASLSKDTTFPELAASQDDNDSSCSCGGDTRETSAFPKAFEQELLTPIGSDVSPASGEGQPSPGQPSPAQQQQQPGVGDLTPIAEATQPTDPTVAQTVCDNKAAQDLAQSGSPAPAPAAADEPVTNDKKRTTSVTFDLSGEGEEPSSDTGSDGSMQETRKQKVLKRLSYPLSWMESFSAERESLPQPPGMQPSSAPPVGPHPLAEGPEGTKPGVFSNVFSMSNVSNMLSRRPSMDFARRPTNQQPLLPPAAPVPSTTVSNSIQQPAASSGVPVIQQQQQQQQMQQQQLQHQQQQAQKRAQYKEGPKFGLKSMVSMDDMPELFASFDKLIPKPATSCEDPPLYLCLRMGKPANRRIPKSTPVMSYGKKRMRPEYWFSIPKNRSDELYNFFQLWAHDIYGELNEEEVASRGFILVEEDTELWTEQDHERAEAEDGIGGELTEMTKESWEVVSMSEELRRALYSSSSLTSLDLEAFLPEVVGTSDIITDTVRKNMYRKLPARAQGYAWKLVFSTSQHGFSLNSLYRKMSDVESPIILFIQDTNQNTFGAVLSESLHVSDLYYGTGESFLFAFQPEFQVFPWTGENTFFVKGNYESLIVGGGDGNFGLWLDGDLYQGRTQPCKTFNNPQLTDTEDFIIKAVECWCFE